MKPIATPPALTAGAMRTALTRVTPGLVVGLSSLPALLVLWATMRGPGLSPDSVYYASTARSFASGHGLVQYDGQPFTWFPPGLPLLLGLGEVAGLDLMTTTVLLNMVAATGIVWLTYAIARDLLGPGPWALAAAVIIATSSALFGVQVMLWTEPLFTCFVMLTLRLLQGAIARRRVGARVMLALMVSVGGACALRYVGVLLLPLVGLGVHLALRQVATPRLALRRATGAVVLTALPAMGIMLRNVWLGSAPMGARARPDTAVPEVLDRTLQTLGSFVDPRGGVAASAAMPGVIVAMAITIGLVLALLRWGAVHRLLAIYVVVYVAAIWWAALTTQLDAIDQRLLSPALPVIVILIVAAVRHGFSRPEFQLFAAPRANAVRLGLVAVLLTVTTLNLADALPRAAGFASTGIGYNHVSSLASPLANALRSLPAGGMAASDPWLAYWVSGRTPMLQVPRANDHYWSPDRTATELRQLLDSVRVGHVRYVAL